MVEPPVGLGGGQGRVQRPGVCGENKTKHHRGLRVQSAEQCAHNSVSEKCVLVLSVQRSRVTSNMSGLGCQSAYRFNKFSKG